MIYKVEFQDKNNIKDGGFFCMKHIIKRLENGSTIISQKKTDIECAECEDCLEWFIDDERGVDGKI